MRFPKERCDEKSGNPFPWRLALVLSINTLLIFGIYCFFVMRQDINWIFWVYYGALAASALAYVIINRGFALDKLTPSSLPPDWSEEKKQGFLRARDERKRKSKWLLTIIFPLCLTVFFDIIYLFFRESIVEALKTVASLLEGF